MRCCFVDINIHHHTQSDQLCRAVIEGNACWYALDYLDEIARGAGSQCELASGATANDADATLEDLSE